MTIKRDAILSLPGHLVPPFNSPLRKWQNISNMHEFYAVGTFLI